MRIPLGASPCTPLPSARYRRQTTPTMPRTPSERDRRTFSAVLCVWVLVSERGLEPPRGYTPHQVHTLVRSNTRRLLAGRETPSRRTPRRPHTQTPLLWVSRGVTEVSSRRVHEPHSHSPAPHLCPTNRLIVRVSISTSHRKALSSPQKTRNAPKAVHQFPRVHGIPSRVSPAIRWYRPTRLTATNDV